MEKQQLVEQAKEKLTPFETGNIIEYIQNLTLKSAMEQPLLIVTFLVFAYYAVVKRSKVVLVLIFAAISTMLLVRYTLSPEMVGGGLTLASTLPFIVGGLTVGIALIYLTIVKDD